MYQNNLAATTLIHEERAEFQIPACQRSLVLMLTIKNAFAGDISIYSNSKNQHNFISSISEIKPLSQGNRADGWGEKQFFHTVDRDCINCQKSGQILSCLRFDSCQCGCHASIDPAERIHFMWP